MTTSILPGAESFSAHGSNHGVLVLHGFSSDPRSMRPLADALADHGYTVELPRLPGHGTSVADLGTTTWTDWSTAAETAFDELAARCERVAIVGLSMGGALAAWLAERKSPLAALVLINPLVKPPVIEMVDGLRQLVEAGVETLDAIGSDIKKSDVKESSYDAIPTSSVASLFTAVEVVYADLAKIVTPVLLFSSRDDHVVSLDNGEAVVEHVSGPVARIWLEDSFHVATLDNDAALLEAATVEFFDSAFSS